jgi:hypothetical protein
MRSKSRSAGRLALTLPLVTLIALGACTETTGIVTGRPGPVARAGLVAVPLQTVYSMSPGSLTRLADIMTSDAVAGPRWCSYAAAWFDPSRETCLWSSQQPPYGSVTTEGNEIIVRADATRAAPFLWTAQPDRPNPFPETGDFTVELRLSVEQLAGYGTGVFLSDWNPATLEGGNSPFKSRVMQIWADGGGLRAYLLGTQVNVPNPLSEHEYRLVYKNGTYSLLVDGEPVADPVESDRRPTAIWMGNPTFTTWAGDWTDFRVSQLTIGIPADEVVEVPVDVKPGSCPSPVSMREKGMLPVAIAGTAELDVSQIDPSTLRLAGVAPVRHAFEDVTAPVEPYTGKTLDTCTSAGPDGMDDLTLKFSSFEVVDSALSDATAGDRVTLELTGTLLPEFGGTPIRGEDVVVVRGH